MKKHIVFVSVVSLVLALSAVRAQAMEWSGTQILTTVGAERPVGDGGWSLFGFLLDMRIPKAGSTTDCGYFGPSLFKKVGGLDVWATVLVAGSTNFIPGRDAVGPSAWLVLSNERASLFLEGDLFFGSGGRKSYYGLYVIDLKLDGDLKLGTHLEQVDKNLQYGPHACMKKGVLTFCANYFVSADAGSNTIRFHTAFNF